MTDKPKTIQEAYAEVRNRSLNEAIPLPPRRPQTGPAGTASQPQDNNPRGEEVKRIENRGGEIGRAHV